MGGAATRLGRHCGAVLLLVCACARPAALPPPPPLPPRVPVPPPACTRIERIEVIKSTRLVRAHCVNGALVEMNAALGREPEGPKREAGDARTPEGEYRISGPPRASRFHVFVPIDYPSVADAETARDEARLSEAAYQRILSAHAHGEHPPGDTALGGALGFHGEGARWRGDSRYLDWTYGCVALSDQDIDFLADHSDIGTRVVIMP